jgi:hypothetical protein
MMTNQTTEILNEELDWKLIKNNLAALKARHAADKEKYGYRLSDPVPTKATESFHEIHEKETGMPIAIAHANSYGDVNVTWHPTMLAMHPKLGESILHNLGDYGKFRENGSLNRNGVRTTKRLKSKSDISGRMRQYLEDAHADGYRDPFKVTRESEEVPHPTEYNPEQKSTVTKMHFHDQDTGNHIVTITKDGRKGYGTVANSTDFNQNLEKELSSDEASKHKEILNKTDIGYEVPFKTVQNFIDATKASKPYAIGTESGNGYKKYKIADEPEKVSTKHEIHMASEGYATHRHSPTVFTATKDKDTQHSIVHDGLLHVTGGNTSNANSEVLR